MSLLERVFFFHQEIERRRFPNSKTLIEEFEISRATAIRDISYLRERLLAPLAFDTSRNGYYYREEGFQLPFGDSPRIVFMMAMLGKLAGEAGLSGLPEVSKLEERLSSLISADYREVVSALHCERIEVESFDEKIFAVIVDGLARHSFLAIGYKAVGGPPGDRLVAPLKIVNYQGRWYLYGYCQLRRANRLFHLARIRTAEVTDTGIPPEITTKESDFGESFGIFSGKPRFNATIRFYGTAAELVKNQRWHRHQSIQKTEDGILLSLPVRDDRELVMKILQYGRQARVISPPELIARLAAEVKAMHILYHEGAPPTGLHE